MDFIEFGYVFLISSFVFYTNEYIRLMKPRDHHKEFMDRLIND